MFRPPALPEPLVAVLGEVRAWTRDAEPLGLTPEERASWVVGLQQLRDAADAAMLSAVASFDAAGDGELLHGAASTQSWLRGALGVAPGEASERVRLARAARGMLSRSTECLREGELTYDHVRAVERAVRHLPAEHQPDAVDVLTDLAAQSDVTAVRTAGRHLRLVTDPDGALSDAEQQFDRRHLTLSPLLDGMTSVDGLLDTEGAALLSAALEPFLVPEGSDDIRSAGQRRADGLLQLVQTACDHRPVPTVGSERPHLQVVVDRAERTGARLRGGSLLHPLTLGRLACDSQVTTLLLDEHGVVTDLGRTQRLFSPQQRKLLSARDGGCRWLGCGRPPGHTDAHHVQSWFDGGSSDVANAILLCRFHHRKVHEGGWSLSPIEQQRGSNGPVTATGPRGQMFVTSPRGP